MPQSEELTEFYRSYAIWVDEGAPDQAPFLRMDGLCWNLRFFATCCEYPVLPLMGEMKEQFKAAGLPALYPFDKNPYEHSVERGKAAMHTNPKRLAWVKEHCDA